jgi:endogenous inhibitor of DNA gyrase (YacG/DUF329 family)
MMTKANNAPTCPICKRESEEKFRPFCSKRCADVDLGRWFNEDYAVPAAEPPDDWDGQIPGADGDGDGDEGDSGGDNGGGGLLH